jgi:hypothetical protein
MRHCQIAMTMVMDLSHKSGTVKNIDNHSLAGTSRAQCWWHQCQAQWCLCMCSIIIVVIVVIIISMTVIIVVFMTMLIMIMIFIIIVTHGERK